MAIPLPAKYQDQLLYYVATIVFVSHSAVQPKVEPVLIIWARASPLVRPGPGRSSAGRWEHLFLPEKRAAPTVGARGTANGECDDGGPGSKYHGPSREDVMRLNTESQW